MNDTLPRRRPGRPKNPPLHSKDPVDLGRHRRKCQICNHPSRELIEESFINWHPNYKVIQIYKLDVDAFYRHCHAFDLYAKRKANIRPALEHIIERGVETQISGDTLIRAVRAYTCLTDNNQWIEPAAHVIVSKAQPDASLSQPGKIRAALAESAPAIDIASDTGPRRPAEMAGEAVSNKVFSELENDLSN